MSGEPLPSTFAKRGRIRRRLRYLRRLREVQFRDLGGFMVELHRFGRDRPALIAEKLAHAAATDAELRELEQALGGTQPTHDLPGPGIGGSCARCGTLYGSSDRFCASCGEQVP
jgi:hypothetical protein